ncbi:hypothetical protein ACH5RR_001380 [Cinchona calisaya]|uniref:MADS-box domain-containing protein n=1 Tax=Cinchona calisaya TaxID=153742 RepID=A0ABD3B3J2_9GENT
MKQEKQQAGILKTKSQSYKKRKEFITKKTTELSVPRDVKACVVVCEPNEKKVETLPKNPENVREIINFYEDFSSKNSSNKRDSDPTIKAENPDDDTWLMGMSEQSIQDILREVDLKIEAVAKRIDFLKRKIAFNVPI